MPALKSFNSHRLATHKPSPSRNGALPKSNYAPNSFQSSDYCFACNFGKKVRRSPCLDFLFQSAADRFTFSPFCHSCRRVHVPTCRVVLQSFSFLIFMANHVEHETYQNERFLATNRLCVRDYAKKRPLWLRPSRFVWCLLKRSAVGQLAACTACVWLKLNDSVGPMCDMTIKSEAFRGAIAKTTTQFRLDYGSWKSAVVLDVDHCPLGNCTINSLRFWQIIPSVWLQISLRCFWVKGSRVSSRLLFCWLQWTLAGLTFDIRIEFNFSIALLTFRDNLSSCDIQERRWIRLQAPSNPISIKIHPRAVVRFSKTVSKHPNR